MPSFELTKMLLKLPYTTISIQPHSLLCYTFQPSFELTKMISYPLDNSQLSRGCHIHRILELTVSILPHQNPIVQNMHENKNHDVINTNFIHLSIIVEQVIADIADIREYCTSFKMWNSHKNKALSETWAPPRFVLESSWVCIWVIAVPVSASFLVSLHSESLTLVLFWFWFSFVFFE